MLTTRRWWALFVSLAAFCVRADLRAPVWPSIAAAQAPMSAPCDGPIVRTSASSPSDWATALEQLRERLRSFTEVDRCAVVELAPEGGQILVTIRLADGRIAERRVNTLVAAVASVEALLTVLPNTTNGERAASEAPAKPTETDLAPAASAAREPEAKPWPTSEQRAPGRVVEIDVGIGASLHVAGRPWFVGYGLAAHVTVAINQWLLGSWARWDIQDRLVEGSVPHQFIASSFLLGAFTGRRFFLADAALDVVVGPNLVVDTEEAAGPGTDDVGGELGSLSLGAQLRVLVPRHGSPAFFGMCGGELNPERVSRHVRADPSLPALPAWGGSLVLGVAWTGL